MVEKIYVVGILAELLYGSESWVWNLSMLNTIRGFYHCASQRLANKRPKRLQNGTYVYCNADEALNDCKLLPIQVYITQRRQHTFTCIKKKVIYNLCRTTKKSTSTPTGTIFWWEQDLSHWIDLTEDGSPLARVVQGKGI